MSEARPQWTDDVEALNALVQRQADALAARQTQLAERDAQIESLNERIRQLLAQRFEASSEQVSDAPLGLFNEAEAQATPEVEEAEETCVNRRSGTRMKPRRHETRETTMPIESNGSAADPRSFLPDEVLADLSREAGEARGLPNAAFTTDAFLALENRYLFSRSWVFAGRASAVSNPGDVEPVEAGGRSSS